MSKKELVVLVDRDGHERHTLEGAVYTMDKIEAHRRGLRHRAVSVFIFNHEGELLLQKRSNNKYHSAGLWTNTCCTHPRAGESPQDAAVRRLWEEMGIECEVTELLRFPYYAKVSESLWENEYDHGFFGFWSGTPNPDLNEVSSWKWVQPDELLKDIAQNKNNYTCWLRYCIQVVLKQIKKHGIENFPAKSPRSAQFSEHELERKSCFVICPLGDFDSPEWAAANLFLEKIVKPVLRKFGYDSENVEWADLTSADSEISSVTDKRIVEADLVVADLTGCTAKVCYELGKRHAVGGKTVQFTRDRLRKLPIDILKYQTFGYDLNNPKKVENAKKDFEKELKEQHKSIPAGMSLTLEELSSRFRATVLIEVLKEERQHYTVATAMLRPRCKRIILMQRSSTMILGPRAEWDDEKTFYELLYQQIMDGAEFYHIVSIEGIERRHKDLLSFPDRKEALGRLSRSSDIVGIDGKNKLWDFKRVPILRGEENPKPDRQARALLVEFEDQTWEAVLVLDLGIMPAGLYLRGPAIRNLMKECKDFYNNCPKLHWETIDKLLEEEDT